MCPAGEQKSEKKPHYFSSLMCIRLPQICSLCLSSKQKKHMVKSKPTFSSEQLHVFSPPVLVLVSSTYIRHNKCPKRRVWSEKCVAAAGESVEFCQLGFLAGAIPLFCPVSVYLKRRDYSCSCCQQRASFRLSPLHSMTSAGPSHLQDKTHKEWESLLHRCIWKKHIKTAYRHLKRMPKYEALFESQDCVEMIRGSCSPGLRCFSISICISAHPLNVWRLDNHFWRDRSGKGNKALNEDGENTRPHRYI